MAKNKTHSKRKNAKKKPVPVSPKSNISICKATQFDTNMDNFYYYTEIFKERK